MGLQFQPSTPIYHQSIRTNQKIIVTLDPFSAKQTPAPQHPPQPLPQSFDAPHFLPSDPLRCPIAFDPAADDEDVPHLLLSSWLYLDKDLHFTTCTDCLIQKNKIPITT